MAYQTVAPFYSARVGRLGAPHLPSAVRPLGEPTHFSALPAGGVPPGAGPGVRVFSGVRVGGGTRGLGDSGDLRGSGSSGAGDALGPGGWTVATVIGSGMGGSIVGFVAGRGDKDATYRGGFFSAALAGMGASFGHLRNDESKLFGASLLIASLWTMGWALRPMVQGGAGAARGWK